MLHDMSYETATAKAAALKALGVREVYLSGGQFPWHLAERCEAGSSFRNGIATSAWFSGTDAASGLSFKWTFDLESRDANGAALFKIDTKACRNVMVALPNAARASFREWLMAGAAAVREKAAEYQKAADGQRVMASQLSDLCSE